MVRDFQTALGSIFLQPYYLDGMVYYYHRFNLTFVRTSRRNRCISPIYELNEFCCLPQTTNKYTNICSPDRVVYSGSISLFTRITNINLSRFVLNQSFIHFRCSLLWFANVVGILFSKEPCICFPNGHLKSWYLGNDSQFFFLHEPVEFYSRWICSRCIPQSMPLHKRCLKTLQHVKPCMESDCV